MSENVSRPHETRARLQPQHVDLALFAVACLVLLGAWGLGAPGKGTTSATPLPSGAFARESAAVARESAAMSRVAPPPAPDAGTPPDGRPLGGVHSLLPGVPEAAAVKRELRNMTVVQEVYFSEHSTYASSVDELAPLGLTLRSGATVRILHAGTTGWAAEAVRPGSEGVSCVVFVSAQPGDGPPATRRDGRRGTEGVPVCDGDR